MDKILLISRNLVPFLHVIMEQFSIECCNTKLWKIVELRVFPFDLWPMREACGPKFPKGEKTCNG